MTTRTSCAACGQINPEIFLDLGKTPLANKFPTEADLGQETWYPLQLGRCGSCGLVQMMEIIPDDEIYGEDYGFYSGGSQAQRDYHAKGAGLMADRHLRASNGPGQLVVEVACNDGSMLQHFHDRGFNAIGIDPAKPADIAIEQGMNVIKEPFTYALARQIREDHGTAKLVIAYNSLAHVGNLPDVLAGIRELLDQDGVVVVEVQYLPDLLAGGLYDQVYHEHRYYHSLSSFKRAAELHGLFVQDAELIELQGGGIRITLSPRMETNNSMISARRVDTILAREAWLLDPGTYSSFQGRIDRMRDHLLAILDQQLVAGKRIVGYAAAAKATTILNFCGLGPEQISAVIDTTEYKQGRYVPGTGIPIVASAGSDLRLLLAPNYLAHVLRSERDFSEIGGRWLIPIPMPAII